MLPVPVNLSKLSDVAQNDVKKIYVSNAKIKNIDDKIPDITNLANKTTLSAKINKVKGEIPNITNLATETALNTVENEVPSVNNLLQKTVTQKLMKLKTKLLIIIMINISLLQYLIS